MKPHKAMIVGIGALLVMGFAIVPSGAVHITGNQQDVLASTLSGGTVMNNDWWAGNTLLIPHPAPGVIPTLTVRDAFDAAGLDCEDFFTPQECDTELVTDFDDPVFAFGVVICERNTIPAASGWGGRCFSHRYEENVTDPGKKTKEPETHVKSLDKDEWWRMQVEPNGTAPPDCGSEFNGKRVIGYFARMGNNDHGIQVEAGNDFHYRPKLAQLLDDNHITYFINADETGLLPLLCWGHDWHADADPPEAGEVDAKGRETACNNIKDDDYDAFDPATYDRDGPVEQSDERWNTVCTAPNPNM